MNSTTHTVEDDDNVMLFFGDDDQIKKFEDMSKLYYSDQISYEDLMNFYPQHEDIMMRKIFRSILNLLDNIKVKD